MYEEMTPEKIKGDILAAITNLDVREGSFADDMAGPLAVEFYKAYGALNAVQPMVWVDATSGKYLDMAAADLGLEPRKVGTKAAAVLKITGEAGFTIKSGATFVTEEGHCFSTVAAALLPGTGVAEVAVAAAEVGNEYNVPPGAICRQYENDSRITAVTNPAAAEGGTDPEGDASLYSRIETARKKPSTSGNLYDYEKWALECPGIGAVKVTPIWNGAGTVKVLVADDARQPVDSTVVAACAAHIEAVRPVGAAVTVLSALTLPISATATVTVDASTTKAAVEERFKRGLDAYLRALAFKQYEVLYNRVGALLMTIDGVIDYSGLTLNGTATSVLVGAEQVPVIGEVKLL